MENDRYFVCNDGFQVPLLCQEYFAIECLKAFTCKAISSSENYSSGSTFFVSACSKPNTLLENLALSIFRFHTSTVSFDANKSGAEWWTQVIDSEHNIGIHWDR